MMNLRTIVLSVFMFACLAPWATGQDPAGTTSPAGTDNQDRPQLTPATPAAGTFAQVIGRGIERERFFVAHMRHLHPQVETYTQNLKGQAEEAVPVSDEDFLGRRRMCNG